MKNQSKKIKKIKKRLGKGGERVAPSSAAYVDAIRTPSNPT
jgi:hypothetical protein